MLLFPAEIELGVLEDELVLLVGEGLDGACRSEQGIVLRVANLVVEDDFCCGCILIDDVDAGFSRVEDGAMIADVHVHDGRKDIVPKEIIVAKTVVHPPDRADRHRAIQRPLRRFH